MEDGSFIRANFSSPEASGHSKIEILDWDKRWESPTCWLARQGTTHPKSGKRIAARPRVTAQWSLSEERRQWP